MRITFSTPVTPTRERPTGRGGDASLHIVRRLGSERGCHERIVVGTARQA